MRETLDESDFASIPERLFIYSKGEHEKLCSDREANTDDTK